MALELLRSMLCCTANSKSMPSTSVTTDDVLAWVGWAEHNLPAGEYPKIDAFPENCPWHFDSLFYEDQNSLTTALEYALLRNPSVVTRFVTLSVCYLNSASFEGDAEEEKQLFVFDANENIRQGFRRMLSHFVRMLPIGECAEWKRTRWEILNSYACSEWGLAKRLYVQAEEHELLDRNALRLIRGQFSLFLALNAELGNLGLTSMLWEPEPLSELMGSKRAPLFVLLWRWCVSIDGKEPFTDDQAFDRLNDCVHGLTSGLRQLPRERPLYLPLLGLSHYLKGDFVAAAHCYEELLVLLTEGNDAGRDELLSAISVSYERAGRFAEAIAATEKCAQEFPLQEGLYSRIAMLHAKSGRYEAVAEALRNEQDRNPLIAEDWKNSAILGLGSVRSAAIPQDLVVDAFYKHESDLAVGIEKTVAAGWPKLKVLGDKPRRTWIYGVYLANFRVGDASFRENVAESAVVNFAKAIELELKDRLFLKYREFASKDPQVNTWLTPAPNQRDPLIQFLKARYPKITIGEMYEALNQAQNARTPLQRHFKEWVKGASPGIIDWPALAALSDLPRISGGAKHGSIESDDVVRIQELGRRILEALT